MQAIAKAGTSAQAVVGHVNKEQFDPSGLYLYKTPALPKPSLTAEDFDDDDDDWYVQKTAHELGLNHKEVWANVVAGRAKRAELLAIAARTPPDSATESPPAPTLGGGSTTPWPPGRAGAIARYLFKSSYLPIQEVAITATLGLLAGVCGRAYRTHTGKDLALYIILVAKSGVGKDGIHEGIPRMLEMTNEPMAHCFLRAEDFVSGEALHKTLLRGPGFLYLQGEVGRKLKRMANPTDAPMQTFRTVLTNTYAKQYLEGKTYARADDSLMGVEWPALSFLGETTPSTFLESLTSDMMQDGFLSRFLITTYEEGQPAPNKQRNATLPPIDLQMWTALVQHAVKYLPATFMPESIVAKPTGEAEAMLEAFETTCRNRLNALENDTERHVWTRAHLKALKISSLLAVIDHYLEPTVKREHAAWAIELVTRDIDVFLSNQRNGDVGAGNNVRERKLVSLIRDYITKKTISAAYKVPTKMHVDGLVTQSYLAMRTSGLAPFTNHKLGANKALGETVANLVRGGYLMECKQDKIVQEYNHHGKTYRILGLPD